MRLWSIHPKYLDAKGLVALWRETLLAKKVLQNKTRGYKQHPQLIRFKKLKRPVDAIDQYLHIIWIEADSRNYKFDRLKFSEDYRKIKVTLSTGQLDFESMHLLKKLKARDMARYKLLRSERKLDCHPIFRLKKGSIESWEII